MQETVQTFLVAVLTGLVYAGIRVGVFHATKAPGPTDVEKGLWRGIPVESLRGIQVVVAEEQEENEVV